MRPAGWPGRGRLGEGSPNRVGSATRKWLPRSLGCGPELPPPCVPLPPQQGSGDAEAGECPRSQNMSTAQDGRRAAGASEGTAQIFGRPPEPRAPLSHHKSALSIKKGRTATLRTAAITPRESERATTVQALFRVLPKCPATLPGPRSPVGDRPLLTCLSLSAAIRGCLSWSCFLRSPFWWRASSTASASDRLCSSIAATWAALCAHFGRSSQEVVRLGGNQTGRARIRCPGHRETRVPSCSADRKGG